MCTCLTRMAKPNWLTPEVQLATSTGLNQRQLREALSVIETHLGEINNACHSHFGA